MEYKPFCLNCLKPLRRGKKERPVRFQKRLYCNITCFHADRKRHAQMDAVTKDKIEPPRYCPCGKELIRKPKERPSEWRERKYCNFNCYAADKTQRAAEKKAEKSWRLRGNEVRVSQRLNFDKPTILRAAMVVAPNAKPEEIVAIVNAIEPLIAANVRGTVLAAIADDVKAKRPTV